MTINERFEAIQRNIDAATTPEEKRLIEMIAMMVWVLEEIKLILRPPTEALSQQRQIKPPN